MIQDCFELLRQGPFCDISTDTKASGGRWAGITKKHLLINEKAEESDRNYEVFPESYTNCATSPASPSASSARDSKTNPSSSTHPNLSILNIKTTRINNVMVIHFCLINRK